jgi:hypothetical protein
MPFLLYGSYYHPSSGNKILYPCNGSKIKSTLIVKMYFLQVNLTALLVGLIGRTVCRKFTR